MLKVTVHGQGDIAILRCEGRLVAGVEAACVWSGVRSRRELDTLFLDLAQVERIDAAGLGILLTLRAWARSRGIQLHLMNVPERVAQLLELTRLDGVFDIFRVEALFQPLSPPAQWAAADAFSC
jgi:anti-sigma B factor antagonist